MLFWATCLKAKDTPVFQSDAPCPGVPQSQAHPKAHPKAPGLAQHPDPACSTAVSAVESTPCNKEGISGKQWQIHWLAVLRGSNPNPWSLVEEEPGTDPESAAPSRRGGHSQCGSGKGNEPMLPMGHRPRQCQPGAVPQEGSDSGFWWENN